MTERICRIAELTGRKPVCIHVKDESSPLPCGTSNSSYEPVCIIALFGLQKYQSLARGGVAAEILSYNDQVAFLTLEGEVAVTMTKGQYFEYYETLGQYLDLSV